MITASQMGQPARLAYHDISPVRADIAQTPDHPFRIPHRHQRLTGKPFQQLGKYAYGNMKRRHMNLL